MFTLITGTEQHENANYWYRITRKLSVICTGVVALASPAARAIKLPLSVLRANMAIYIARRPIY